MFAIEARSLGYRIHTYSPESDTPTGQVADFETVAAYEDLEAVCRFARGVDVITVEFENVPATALDAAAEFAFVHPRGDILHIAQNRLREKTFLRQNGFPIVPFSIVETFEQLKIAIDVIGTPSVLKTAGFGYDGKGQVKITQLTDIETAYAQLGDKSAVLEAFVEFEKEVSVVCARDQAGNFVHYPIFENSHRNHILDISFAPAAVLDHASNSAAEIAADIAEKLDYVGTLCVEFFLTAGGELLVNEIAPRPHNSGHLTIEACETSQFGQQVRAVCGLPLGSTVLKQPSAMANLLGELWTDGEPNWDAALADERVKLHLYGKSEAKNGRKMGHLTALASTPEAAIEAVRFARASLTKR